MSVVVEAFEVIETLGEVFLVGWLARELGIFWYRRP